MQSILLSPYLIFDGNAREAFECYKSVFGGEYSKVTKAAETGGSSRLALDHLEREKLTYISLPLPGGQLLKGCDKIHSFTTQEDFRQGNNQFIALRTQSADDAKAIFEALSVGGLIKVPLQAKPWGDLFSELTDRFGVQ